MKLYEFFGGFDNSHKDTRDELTGKTKKDDEKMADELFWFILDDDQLHKECFLPLAKEINSHQKEESFDHSKYIKKWLPMVNKGCMKFYKKHEMTEDPRDVFPIELRKSVCNRLADQHHKDIEAGEYKLN